MVGLGAGMLTLAETVTCGAGAASAPGTKEVATARSRSITTLAEAVVVAMVQQRFEQRQPGQLYNNNREQQQQQQ